ncbi:hypothetical protein PUH89_00870 [Rhodobacter capsulatus]|uniref:hypothetical protein n=1 Tax=Rhodobacter capsulatus TaxID=1061 RepID=UPI001113C8B2|nr:hypothetical protein [Rhodobacter capsulatus]WER09561.1 hypothetical protein PUH89_00870 [Rhodobacter capsulatus]
MIIGPDFIWLHVPKCAGTALERALNVSFKERSDIHFDVSNQRFGPIIWHQNIVKRQEYDPNFDPAGKRIIANIRRLPHWILSRIHFEAARTPDHIPTREMLATGQFYNASGTINKANGIIRRFNQPEVTDWIRVENIEEDAKKAFKISKISIPRVNETSLKYIKDLSFWFTSKDLANLYARNPDWARVEEKVYGKLLEV